MIPLIGFMIGAYIFTRMLEILLDKEAHGAIVTMAIITMIVVIVSVIMLFGASLKIPGQ